MSITEDGREGEDKTRLIIKKCGWNLFQIDWMAVKGGKYFLFESKNKEFFTPPPFLGTGLNIGQVIAREEFRKKIGIRTILFVFNKKTGDSYFQFLDKLEQGEKHDTKNKIRIYPIKNYIKLNDPSDLENALKD